MDRYVSLRGCSTFKLPKTPVRPRLSTGGLYQQFEDGEIAVYRRWAKDAGAETPDFVLSGSLSGDKVFVDWGSTKPFAYDFFNLRWELDNHFDGVEKQHEDGNQQIKVVEPGFGSNRWVTLPKKGTYLFHVQGCMDGDLSTLGASQCDQGWSHPISIDYLPVALELPVPSPLEQTPMLGTSILDMPASSTLTDPQYRPIVEEVCKGEFHDEEHELETTTAVANIVASIRGWNCPGLNAARQAIRDSGIGSQVGTNVAPEIQNAVHGAVQVPAGVIIGVLLGGLLAVILAFFSAATGYLLPLTGALTGAVVSFVIGYLDGEGLPGDYDMHLTGLIPIAYRYELVIGQPTFDDILDRLLTIRGHSKNRKELVWFSGHELPIPETENHIFMTEAARYLTNELLRRRLVKQNLPVPADLDNDKNGMTDWVLNQLRDFLVEDFYELNSRPYSAVVIPPIQNLAEFAAWEQSCIQVPPAGVPASPRSCEVKRAARNVLDFLAAKFAASSNELRRSAPFRRQNEYVDYPRLLTTGGDDLTWRYAAYTAGSDLLREERYGRLMEGSYGYLLSVRESSYRPPVMIADLIRSPVGPTGSMLQRFHSTQRGGDLLEVYYREPAFLISAGGKFDMGRMGFPNYIQQVVTGEDALVLPTTLMPTKAGQDWRDFVRIEGHVNRRDRVNLCVGPGFACGTNPMIPAGLPSSCTRVIGRWTFIDFDAQTTECPFGYGFYVAMYKDQCSDFQCLEAAGGIGPGGAPAEFGFFEASEYRNFDAYVADVLALNQSFAFRFDKLNTFMKPKGGRVNFRFDDEKGIWAIVDYDRGDGVTIRPPRRTVRWALANGDLMRAPREACLHIDNIELGQRLVIDHTDWRKPRRAIVKIPSAECTCPLPDSCINFRSE